MRRLHKLCFHFSALATSLERSLELFKVMTTFSLAVLWAWSSLPLSLYLFFKQVTNRKDNVSRGRLQNRFLALLATDLIGNTLVSFSSFSSYSIPAPWKLPWTIYWSTWSSLTWWLVVFFCSENTLLALNVQ